MNASTKKVKFLIPILFLLIAGVGLAQDLRISSIDFPQSYRTSTIIDLAQDPHGNIWLASENQGLLKYDGTSFSQFSHDMDNPNSLIADRLECILVDRNGIIWVGGFDAGLSRFDPVTETFSHFQHNETDTSSLRSNSIRSLVQDHDGIIWIGTVQGLDRLDPITFQISHHLSNSQDAQILDEEHIRVLYVDREGTLWAGGSGPFYGEESKGGLFRINVVSKRVQRYYRTDSANSLIDNQITALHEDSKGTFWVGTVGDGLHSMNREKGTFEVYKYDAERPDQLSRPPIKNFSYAADHIRFIQEDDQGNIWIGTMGNGINRYDPRTQTVQSFGSDAPGNNKLPTDYFWNCLKTFDGLLWITSWDPSLREQILLRVNLSPNQLDQKDIGKPVIAFEEGEDGSIYIGSNNELIQIDKNGNESVVLQFEPSVPNRLNHLNKDSSGNLWISSETGLFKFDISANSVRPYNANGDNLTNPTVLTSEIIDENRILVGTVDGLYLLEVKQERFTKLEHSIHEVVSQTQNSVRIVFKDSRNNIWIGLHNYGLKRFDIEKQEFIDYPFLESVQNRITSIYEDDHQNLYVGGRRIGLRKYNPETDQFSVIIDESGLLTENTGIFGIKASGDSILWLKSPSGLTKYEVKTNTGFLFDRNWLRPGTIFSSFGIFKSSQEDFYFGINNGFVKFRSEDFARKSNYRPTPFVSKFQVNNELISLKDKFRFNHDQNNISITLGYINFLTGSGENGVKYRLENYDSDWRVGENDEEIIYYKLSPGSYTFRSKAMDAYGEWTEKSLKFTIKPPWWRTWWAYIAYAIFFTIGVFLVDRFQRRRVVARERALARDKELAQAKEIEKAYTQLKTTQNQLIHAEKMASLGELTAGIAHEIQNPLNFVNNFSEVSTELLDEMAEEIDKGDLTEVKSISADIKQNLNKINHHGQRASSIVKGMLDHSRTSPGERNLTDINNLCDEYLRLAYHGMRAKNKNFNCKYEANFQEDLPRINIIPQEIGRVILNLVNNAFQAVQSSVDSRQSSVSSQQSEAKEQDQSSTALAKEGALAKKGDKLINESTNKQTKGLVMISTKQLDNVIQITVSDNGPGIPNEIKDKIFQPFFTTKPTGQGTGLGLSLCYDIVKAHGGELLVESKEGDGTKFKIRLHNKLPPS